MLQYLLMMEHQRNLSSTQWAPETSQVQDHSILSQPDHVAQCSQTNRTCCTLRWEYM